MINIEKSTNTDPVVVIVENIIDIRKNDERIKTSSHTNYPKNSNQSRCIE